MASLGRGDNNQFMNITKTFILSFLFPLLTFASAETLSCDQQGIPVACIILKYGSVNSPDYCRNSVNKDRCAVEVQYGNGRKQRLLGSQCVSWTSDCLSGGKGALLPACADVIDL
jgi:hypothetical protein